MWEVFVYVCVEEGGGGILVRVASGWPQPQEVCPHPEYASRQTATKKDRQLCFSPQPRMTAASERNTFSRTQHMLTTSTCYN